MKTIGRIFLWCVCVLASALLLAELGLRALESRIGIARGMTSAPSPISRALVGKVFGRFEKLWLTPAELKPYPFRPPYDVFVNRGADNPERMARIAERAREPKNGKWRAENFLLPPELVQRSQYEVAINSLGFRDRERVAAKKPKTFRAVAYGAYSTFGFGVDDEKSYVRVLENALNKKWRGGRRRIEVWNGGRPGATAIMGLARLESEFDLLKPDLLIWDFGLVDMALRSDVHPVGATQFRTSPAPLLYHFVKAICPRSEKYPIEICIRSVEYLSRVSFRDALEGWREVNRQMIAFAKAHQVPVILLHHFNVGIPAKEFAQFADPAHGIYFVDTAGEMAKPPDSVVSEFWARANWTVESGTSKEEITAHYPWALYLGDAIQYNERGHELIARMVEKKIAEARLIP